MGQTTVYVGGVADHVYDSGTGTSSPVPNNASQATQASDAARATSEVNSKIAAGTLPAGSPATPVTPPSTLTSANTQPTPGINVPTPTPTGSLGTNTMTQLSGIAASAKALQDSLNASKTASTSTADTDFQTYLKSLTPPPNTADIYSKARADSGVDADQTAVNGYQAQLAAITAKAAADKLSLEGTGRGIPLAVIGGQQAEIDKEAAIQALPISAQLSAAQGNLTIAQDNLDTLFKIRSQDAQDAATYQNKLVDAVYNFADAKQKAQLAALQKTNEQNFSLMTNNLDYAQSLATTAIQNGQPGIAAQLMKLDHNDPNYAANIAVLAKGIQVVKAPTDTQKTAVLGKDLSDAYAQIQGGKDPTAIRQAFLAAHPANAADWNAYFSPGGTGGGTITYPTPTAAAGPGLGTEILNWFKGI